MSLENKDETKEVKKAIKQKKKSLVMIIAVAAIVVVLIIGFLVTKLMLAKSEAKKELQKQMQNMSLKDYPIDDSEKDTIYSTNIIKKTYMFKQGGKYAYISFEGTIIFYNKLCANLYNGITDYDSQKSTEPDLKADSDTTPFGGKIVYDLLNGYFQGIQPIKSLTKEDLSKNIKDAINKTYKTKYKQEIVKEVLVTSEVMQ